MKKLNATIESLTFIFNSINQKLNKLKSITYISIKISNFIPWANQLEINLNSILKNSKTKNNLNYNDYTTLINNLTNHFNHLFNNAKNQEFSKLHEEMNNITKIVEEILNYGKNQHDRAINFNDSPNKKIPKKDEPDIFNL
jgi:hypothetical protein